MLIFYRGTSKQDVVARVKDLVTHVDESRHDEFTSAVSSKPEGAALLR